MRKTEAEIKKQVDRWTDMLELLLYSGSITLEKHEECVQAIIAWANKSCLGAEKEKKDEVVTVAVDAATTAQLHAEAKYEPAARVHAKHWHAVLFNNVHANS